MSESGDIDRLSEVAPVRIDRDGSAFITTIDGDISALLGWTADQLIGRPSTEFIHPQDQQSAIGAWMSMIDEPGRSHQWRGRYRHRDGSWVWIETTNTNRLDDPDHSSVLTMMRRVEHGALSLEEQLRAHEQLLNRLADLLPVGLAHFDEDGVVLATNDLLGDITGVTDPETIGALVAGVVGEDRESFATAIRAVLDDDTAVEDLEVRFRHLDGTEVAGSISLRSLADCTGSVTGGIAIVGDITDHVEMRDALELRATTDALTTCLNRAAVLTALAQVVEGLDGDGPGVAVAYVDIDHFKRINDTYGHAVGDTVLATVALRLIDVVRPGDHVGRLGGDEFLVVCSDVADASAAEELCEHMVEATNIVLADPDPRVAIRTSIGIAFTNRSIDVETIVVRADAAMYRHKERNAIPR